METQGRDDRLSGWRQQFNSDVKFAGKWLKSSGSTMGIQIKDGDGTSRSPQEAAEKIHKYWDQFWQQLKAETPPTEQITEQLLQNTVSLPEERFIIPSVQELVSVAASMRGSGGGDAWVGSELSCLPPEAWQMYRILVERWLAAGRVPEAVKAARTVFLPKEHKVIEGVLQAGDARPITVLSSWWRVLIGTWLKTSQAHQWISQILHPVVVYGKQSDSQVAAGQLLEAYTQAGFLCSLDYTKCFDCLRPSSSVAMFIKTGLDSRFCTIIKDLWDSHVRWPSWGGTVHHEVLATHGLPIPQGECLGPITCCLWLSAGQRYVEAQMGAALTSSIYMDDRSFVARSAEELVQAQRCWADWSGRVGLLESASKTQMTARSQAQKRSLQTLIPAEWFRSDITMLGVVTKGAPRCNAQQERDRLTKAKLRLTSLSTLRLGSGLFAVYARVFSLSLCSYGWLSRLPRKMDCDALWTAVKKGQKVLYSANTWLRAMVHGGLNHLDIITACNLFRVVSVLRFRGQAFWSNGSGSLVAELRKWFKARRFSEVRPWEWSHVDDPSIQVSALNSDKVHLKRMSHLIREGWRFYCWDQFLQTSRHEISTVSHVQASDLRQVKWSAVRALSESCAACRTVAVGGTVSPAWFHARDGEPFSSSCPWCPALGSWFHVCWECEFSPLLASRPPTPSLGITRRFGWSPNPGPVLKYLAEVQKAIWDHRYGRS